VCRELESVVEALNPVGFFKGVVQGVKFGCLLVVCRRVVGIDCENLLWETKTLEHRLEGFRHCRSGVGLKCDIRIN